MLCTHFFSRNHACETTQTGDLLLFTKKLLSFHQCCPFILQMNFHCTIAELHSCCNTTWQLSFPTTLSWMQRLRTDTAIVWPISLGPSSGKYVFCKVPWIVSGTKLEVHIMRYYFWIVLLFFVAPDIRTAFFELVFFFNFSAFRERFLRALFLCFSPNLFFCFVHVYQNFLWFSSIIMLKYICIWFYHIHILI